VTARAFNKRNTASINTNVQRVDGDDDASVAWRRHFREVHRHNHGRHANGKADDGSADDKDHKAWGDGHDDRARQEHQRRQQDHGTSAKRVAGPAGHSGAHDRQRHRGGHN
jgi:hypothetical protein